MRETEDGRKLGCSPCRVHICTWQPHCEGRDLASGVTQSCLVKTGSYCLASRHGLLSPCEALWLECKANRRWSVPGAGPTFLEGRASIPPGAGSACVRGLCALRGSLPQPRSSRKRPQPRLPRSQCLFIILLLSLRENSSRNLSFFSKEGINRIL